MSEFHVFGLSQKGTLIKYDFTSVDQVDLIGLPRIKDQYNSELQKNLLSLNPQPNKDYKVWPDGCLRSEVLLNKRLENWLRGVEVLNELHESEGLSVVKSWGTLEYSGVRLINELKKVIKEIIEIVPNEEVTKKLEN